MEKKKKVDIFYKPNKTKEKALFLIESKYYIINKIGSGSFGCIYKAHDYKTKEYVAIKTEKEEKDCESLLLREIEILSLFKNETGFTKIYSYGQQDDHLYVVMSLLETNLDFLMKKCGGSFALRDIKPENFMIHSNNFSEIYIIDFGLSKKIINEKGKHIPFRDKKGLVGTARYASLNAHYGYELSRRDDLEEIFYLLVYFFKGLPDQFIEIFNHIKGLAFEEEPNYKLILSFLKQIEIEENFEFDWVKKIKKYNKNKPVTINENADKSKENSFIKEDNYENNKTPKKQILFKKMNTLASRPDDNVIEKKEISHEKNNKSFNELMQERKNLQKKLIMLETEKDKTKSSKNSPKKIAQYFNTPNKGFSTPRYSNFNSTTKKLDFLKINKDMDSSEEGMEISEELSKNEKKNKPIIFSFTPSHSITKF